MGTVVYVGGQTAMEAWVRERDLGKIPRYIRYLAR